MKFPLRCLLPLLCLGACAEPVLLPTIVETTPPVCAAEVAVRSWELLGGTGKLPLVTWTSNCFEVAHEGEPFCAHGMHIEGDVFVQVHGVGAWETSLTHELLHALNWRELGHGNNEYVHGAGMYVIAAVNAQLATEFVGTCAVPLGQDIVW
jgi:hypothetical protein